MTVWEKLINFEYQNTHPWPVVGDPGFDTKDKVTAARERYRKENIRLYYQFRDDLEKEFGTSGWKKADNVFDLAYAEGHAYGFTEVYHWYKKLVDAFF